jgi:competence protein ComEA
MKAMRGVGVLMLAAWCAAGGQAGAGSEGKPEGGSARAERAEGRINLNQASKAELMKLTGVGAGTAERIIAYREAHGPFKRVQDLQKVEGVGKGVLEKNLNRLTVK